MTAPDRRPGHAAPPSRATMAIGGRWLLAMLFGWLALDQLLSWRFLGLANPLWLGAGVACTGVLTRQLWRASHVLPAIPVARLFWLLAFALTLYALGGEGRFFYANIDWQVRDAVLRDMAIHPWPFAYIPAGEDPAILRAAIGFFLIPAVAWKAWGPMAGDITLLLQNSVLLTLVLGLGSTVLPTRRARLVTLATITLFSGADIVGQALFQPAIEDHKEFWFDWMQYSSHITQAFWVPQHALAGWIIALLLLLWRGGHLPILPLLIIAPLTALWSPLPLIGAMPLIGYAAAATWRAEALRMSDVGWPLVASALALPGLLYLGAAGDGVGVRAYPLQLAAWVIFVALELLIWALPLWVVWRHSARDKGMVGMATLWLLVCPFIQIGWSIDFMMRASIPALAILAVYAGRTLSTPQPRWITAWLTGALLIGSVTGVSEIVRATALPPAPRGSCSFFGAWDVSFASYPKGSHIAPLAKLPAIIRPANPAIIPVADPSPCWTGQWRRPSGV